MTLHESYPRGEGTFGLDTLIFLIDYLTQLCGIDFKDVRCGGTDALAGVFLETWSRRLGKLPLHEGRVFCKEAFHN